MVVSIQRIIGPKVKITYTIDGGTPYTESCNINDIPIKVDKKKSTKAYRKALDRLEGRNKRQRRIQDAEKFSLQPKYSYGSGTYQFEPSCYTSFLPLPIHTPGQMYSSDWTYTAESYPLPVLQSGVYGSWSS